MRHSGNLNNGKEKPEDNSQQEKDNQKPNYGFKYHN